MRIRKIELNYQHGKKLADCRGSGGHPLPVVGLYGNNNSGKTLMMLSASAIFAKAVTGSSQKLWEKVSSTIEFDLGGSISTGAIKNGVIIQNIVNPGIKHDKASYSNGLLVYDVNRVFNNLAKGKDFAISSISWIIEDYMRVNIKNSVIWIDSFDLGLDCNTANDFLKFLIKKSLEKDNQLIVSTNRIESLSHMPSESRILIGDSRSSVIDQVMIGL